MYHPISFLFSELHLPHFKRKSQISVSTPTEYVVETARKELRNKLHRHLTFGLIASALLHVLFIAGYYGIEYLKSSIEEERIVKVRILKYSDLGPPPSITNSLTTPTVGALRSAKPSIGIPIPVPDAEINPEQTIATQTEMSQSFSSDVLLGESSGLAERIEVENDVKIENDEPGINDFIPVEKPPQIVHAVKPNFPDIARRAGIEATVWVKALIDQTGKPTKAVVIREDGSGIFNEEAIQAALGYQFTPAYMNAGPIKVWVVLKFSFRLVDTKQR